MIQSFTGGSGKRRGGQPESKGKTRSDTSRCAETSEFSAVCKKSSAPIGGAIHAAPMPRRSAWGMTGRHMELHEN